MDPVVAGWADGHSIAQLVFEVWSARARGNVMSVIVNAVVPAATTRVEVST